MISFNDRESGRPRTGESDSAYSIRTGKPMPTHGRRGTETLCGKSYRIGGIVCMEHASGDPQVTCGKCRRVLRRIYGAESKCGACAHGRHLSCAAKSGTACGCFCEGRRSA